MARLENSGGSPEPRFSFANSEEIAMRRVLGGFLACGLMACCVGCDQNATSPSGKTGSELALEEFKKLPVPSKPHTKLHTSPSPQLKKH
jgi:hypothetical protein